MKANSKGAAIILALLITMVVAIMAINLASTIAALSRVTGDIEHVDRAYGIAEGGVFWGKYYLLNHLKDGRHRDLAIPLPKPYRLTLSNDVNVKASLIDLSTRININTLINRKNTLTPQMITRLFNVLAIPNGKQRATDFILALQSAFKNGEKPFNTFSEAALKGHLTYQLTQKLTPYFTALPPSKQTFNINHFTKTDWPVLMALAEGSAKEQVMAFIAGLKTHPILNSARLGKTPVGKAILKSKAPIAFISNDYRVKVKAKWHQHTVTLSDKLIISKRQLPQVLIGKERRV